MAALQGEISPYNGNPKKGLGHPIGTLEDSAELAIALSPFLRSGKAAGPVLQGGRRVLEHVENSKTKSPSRVLLEEGIHFDSYFDGDVQEEDRESMSLVETELQAYFPEEHRITYAIHRWDYPKPLPKDGVCVFLRRE